MLTKSGPWSHFPSIFSQATHPSAKSVSCRPQGVSLMSPGAIALGQFGPVVPSVLAPPRYPVPCFGRSVKVGMYFPTHSNIILFQWQFKFKRDPHQQELSLQITLSVVLTACGSILFRCSTSVKTLFGQNVLFLSNHLLQIWPSFGESIDSAEFVFFCKHWISCPLVAGRIISYQLALLTAMFKNWQPLYWKIPICQHKPLKTCPVFSTWFRLATYIFKPSKLVKTFRQNSRQVL